MKTGNHNDQIKKRNFRENFPEYDMNRWISLSDDIFLYIILELFGISTDELYTKPDDFLSNTPYQVVQVRNCFALLLNSTKFRNSEICMLYFETTMISILLVTLCHQATLTMNF